jgi:hypothetical protein
MLYTALMTDIVKSKKLLQEEREEIQVFIKQGLDILNEVFNPSLVFKVIFSGGDEVQGLFKTPYSAVMFFRLLKMILAPLHLRCGIGVGEWDVQIFNGTSAEQDGSAFHLARSAISQAHKNPDQCILFNSDTENDVYINTLLNVSCLLTQTQSDYQSQIYLINELMHPFFDENSMDLDRFKELYAWVRNKEHLKFYAQRKNRQGNIWRESKIDALDCDPLPIFTEAMLRKKMTLNLAVQRGLSKKISNITNTSRQNIDVVLKNANISTIRNVDLTAMIWIYQHFRGDLWDSSHC